MDGNKKIALNSVIMFLRLCVVSIISLLSARLVLQALGASDYGLYNVVGGIVALLNVVNTAMITTTYRYIAFELGKEQLGNTNKVFNTSLAIHVCFGLLVLIIGLPLGEWYVDNYLNVDTQSLGAAHFVLKISVLTTMIATILVPFQGLLVAYEKFYVSAIFDVISQILRLTAIAFLLYSSSDNKLRWYSLIMLSYNVLYSLMFYVYSFIKHKDTCRLRLYRDVKLYKEMLAFSFWILFGASASVGKTQGSTIIINYFFGTIVNASYAVANQVENFILMFSRMLNQAAVPQITKSFSGGNQDRSVLLASYISKYTFILMLVVSFPVIMEMDFLLNVWLKEVPEEATLFCQLMVVGGLIGCMGEGIPALTQASGKIKQFQLVLSTITLLGLPIAFLCYRLGAPSYTILVVFCLVSVITAVIRLALLKYILGIDVRVFVYTSYSKMVLISIPLIIAYMFYNSQGYTTTQHILGLLLLELFLILDIVVLGLDKREINIIKRYLLKLHKNNELE